MGEDVQMMGPDLFKPDMRVVSRSLLYTSMLHKIVAGALDEEHILADSRYVKLVIKQNFDRIEKIPEIDTYQIKERGQRKRELSE